MLYCECVKGVMTSWFISEERVSSSILSVQSFSAAMRTCTSFAPCVFTLNGGKMLQSAVVSPSYLSQFTVPFTYYTCPRVT